MAYKNLPPSLARRTGEGVPAKPTGGFPKFSTKGSFGLTPLFISGFNITNGKPCFGHIAPVTQNINICPDKAHKPRDYDDLYCPLPTLK